MLRMFKLIGLNMNTSVTFGLPGFVRASRRGAAAAAFVAFVAATAAIAFSPVSVQAATQPALQAVPTVDLARYQGLWYQIAYYPNTFQKQCVSNTTAQYAPAANSQITVTNSCKTADGSTSTAVGAARIKQPRLLGVPLGPGTPSKLEVRFAPAALAWIPGVWANYWVIQLADDYRYAVVGEPTRKFLWILSRTPVMDPADRALIETTLLQQGYDPAKLQEEPQN